MALQVYTPFVTAEFELTNFQVPVDGEVRVSINGRLHEVWLNEDGANNDVGLSFIKRVALKPLPEGRFTLEFGLYSYTTDTEVANAKVVINVVTEETEWADEVVAFSSEVRLSSKYVVFSLFSWNYHQPCSAYTSLLSFSDASLSSLRLFI